MSDHAPGAFDDDLAALRAQTLAMGELAVQQLRDAVTAVVAADPGLADSVVTADARLDVAEAEIEQAAVRLIVQRPPRPLEEHGAGLRDIIAAMKIATNLERCGDLAKNIAKRAVVMSGAKLRSPATGSVDRMGVLVAQRFALAVECYRTRDLAAADLIWRKDEEIDQQYDALFRELLTFMMGDPVTITSSTHMLFVAKNLERIGDHATNIAELVHYQVTGDPMPGASRPKWDGLS